MMNIRNIAIGLGNIINNTYINLTRQNFEVSKDWFETIHIKHYTPDIKAKFDIDLFVDQGIGEEILGFVVEPDKHFRYFINELRVLSDWINEFLVHYDKLKSFLAQEGILINKDSRQYIQLEALKSQSNYFLEIIESHRNILQTNELDKVHTINEFNNTGLETARSFDLNKIEQYKVEDKFISKIVNGEEGQLAIQFVFRGLSEIVTQILNLNLLIINTKNQIYFLYANAGIGKSSLSAFLTTELINKTAPVIFIKGKSFSGDPDQFDKILMNQLEVPDNYKLSEVLEKLNNFGKQNEKRVTIIIDGLNETSFGNNGFSSIWKKNIDEFVNQLISYPYIYFIATLRTSYIDRIWANNTIPYASQELIGFNNYRNLMEVVEKYFKHYKINFNSPDPSDIFYFQTPLLLDLYCKMLNSDKANVVEPIFGLEGFLSVFEQYIVKLAQKIKMDLGLISTEVVTDGLLRCSEQMLKEMGAFLPIAKYYSAIEGKEITFANETVAHNVLEEYLIYLKDSIENKDVVIHTQQEVGGFLLATVLLNQSNNDIKQVVDGDFFQNHIIGDENEKHQLANDIMKFLIVITGDYQIFIEDYGSEPIVKDYLWIKLQREESNELNLELRKALSKQLVSKADIAALLDNAKPRLFNPDSPLNFLFVKEEISKLKGFDFELTWPKYIYQNIFLFSDFLEEEYEGDGRLEIDLEITIWLLETTSHNLRDKATQVILEYGIKEPNFILSKLEEYSRSGRLYIYERLASIAYGVCLRRQNDQTFVESELEVFAEMVYKLQFSSEPSAPSYHYIIIDSFKHIVDLAVHLNVFEVPAEDHERFGKYKFNPADDWQEVTDEEIESVSLQWTSGPDPDPLSGDFVVYTIPSLLSSKTIDYRDAVAHIYKRLLTNGYLPNQDKEMPKGVDRDFYIGVRKYGMEGKVDRLGKKYSWNSFYEYAGYLLNIGKLDVFYDGSDDTGTNSYYQRLTDVKIEASNASRSIDSKQVLSTSLIKDRGNTENWTEIEQFGILDDVYTQKIESDDFTLLYGIFEEGEKKDLRYNMRSFLLVESFLVKKDDIMGKENEVFNRTLDWSDNIYRGSNIRNAYFGELYWADSIAVPKPQTEYIPSTKMAKITYKASPFVSKWENDPPQSDEDMEPVKIPITVEPSLVGYSWISDSDVYNSHTCNVPSPMIGKYLKLKADTEKMHILDENLKRAFISYEYDKSKKNDKNLDKTIEQNTDYMRTDLLKKYLDDKGLVLMYQIKQHTFDSIDGDTRIGVDLRAMQFKIHEFN